MRFNFGAGPVAAESVINVARQDFDADRGWGWESLPAVERNRLRGEPVMRSFAAVPPRQAPAVFRIELPAGRYELTAYAVDSDFPFSIGLRLNREDPAWILERGLRQGQLFSRSRSINWQGGALRIQLFSAADPGDPFSILSALDVRRSDGGSFHLAAAPAVEAGVAAQPTRASYRRDPNARVPVDKTRDLLPPQAYLPDWNTAKHPRYDSILNYLAARESLQKFESTGLTRETYLDLIEGVVRGMIGFQDEDGNIVDPWYEGDHIFGLTGSPGNRKYTHYATPHYAHAAAVVYNSGRDRSPEILDSAIRAFERSVLSMLRGRIRSDEVVWITGDFYPNALMRAYLHLVPHIDAERKARWDEQLAQIEAGRVYGAPAARGNWTIVAHTGEFLRAREGFAPFERVEQMVNIKTPQFTEDGTFMFESYAYDAFSRYHLVHLLNDGYAGARADELRRKMWRGAWMSLLMQTPRGQQATGFRSAHHIWNEAQLAAIFEAYANAYAAAGKPELAGAFKRGANLAIQEVARWVREDGALQIIKNWFHPEKRHGYEGYSLFTTYNCLAAHILATAWEVADDAIVEKPAPADAGGYALVRIEDFSEEHPGGHSYKMVFANAGTGHLQYALDAGSFFEPLGIQRVQFRQSGSVLGPNDGHARKWGDRSQTFAVGPAWMENGQLQVLAASPLIPEVEVLEEHGERVRFRVMHTLPQTQILSDSLSQQNWQVQNLESADNGQFVFAGSATQAQTAAAERWLEGDFTLSLNFRATALSGRQTLIAAFTPGTDNVGLLVELDESSGLRVLFRDPPGHTGGQSRFFPFQAGTENHHLVIRRQAAIAEIWLNGNRLGEVTIPGFGGAELNFLLGRLFPGIAQRVFSGTIGNFAIYDRALNPNMFAQLREGGPANGVPPVLAMQSLTDSGTNTKSIRETIEVTPDSIEVITEVNAIGERFSIIYPIVAFDGKEEAEVAIDGNRARIGLGGYAIEFTILDPSVQLERRTLRLPMPLGEMDLLVGEVTGKEVRYQIRPLAK